MPIYEFQCEKGHITEELTGPGVYEFPCRECLDETGPLETYVQEKGLAKRILSATRTTFKFADRKLK